MARFRCNLFLDRKGMGGVFRVIPTKIPSAQSLGRSKAMLELCPTRPTPKPWHAASSAPSSSATTCASTRSERSVHALLRLQHRPDRPGAGFEALGFGVSVQLPQQRALVLEKQEVAPVKVNPPHAYPVYSTCLQGVVLALWPERASHARLVRLREASPGGSHLAASRSSEEYRCPSCTFGDA